MQAVAINKTHERRFAFGKNWASFLSVLNDERIRGAENKLSDWLGDLRGKSFLDIGSGSGLHSLAAIRLGASRVYSFDYDPDSVGCTQELRTRYAPHADWSVEQGSALDAEYMRSLGKFDVVYSWGVLHHTGDMWAALENAHLPVGEDGLLMVALYNNPGERSRRMWTTIKRSYGGIPKWIRPLYTAGVMAVPEFITMLLHGPFGYVARWREYSKNRGMSRWHDMVDWVGGFPYEVSTPEQVFDFYRERGFALQKMRTCGAGIGCNEFVLRRDTGHVARAESSVKLRLTE